MTHRPRVGAGRRPQDPPIDAADRRRVLVHTGERSQRSCRSLAPQIAEAERSGLSALFGLSALSETEARTLRRLLERLATS